MSKPIGPYTPVVRAGDWLIVSGQVGAKEGALVGGGLQAEVTQAVANLAERLGEAGASLDDVVKTTVFMTHMRDYDLMNEAYTAAFGSNRPARSAVAVVELPLYALVEIEAWAYVGDDS
ncbi:MAG: RidA family protein [Acidimicrobiia bacterium]|nr:RidA family protein [Acidimicrobiia bacterium]